MPAATKQSQYMPFLSFFVFHQDAPPIQTFTQKLSLQVLQKKHPHEEREEIRHLFLPSFLPFIIVTTTTTATSATSATTAAVARATSNGDNRFLTERDEAQLNCDLAALSLQHIRVRNAPFQARKVKTCKLSGFLFLYTHTHEDTVTHTVNTQSYSGSQRSRDLRNL